MTEERRTSTWGNEENKKNELRKKEWTKKETDEEHLNSEINNFWKLNWMKNWSSEKHKNWTKILKNPDKYKEFKKRKWKK
jgi:hypothetical protein